MTPVGPQGDKHRERVPRTSKTRLMALVALGFSSVLQVLSAGHANAQSQSARKTSLSPIYRGTPGWCNWLTVPTRRCWALLTRLTGWGDSRSEFFREKERGSWNPWGLAGIF